MSGQERHFFFLSRNINYCIPHSLSKWEIYFLLGLLFLNYWITSCQVNRNIFFKMGTREVLFFFVFLKLLKSPYNKDNFLSGLGVKETISKLLNHLLSRQQKHIVWLNTFNQKICFCWHLQHVLQLLIYDLVKQEILFVINYWILEKSI